MIEWKFSHLYQMLKPAYENNTCADVMCLLDLQNKKNKKGFELLNLESMSHHQRENILLNLIEGEKILAGLQVIHRTLKPRWNQTLQFLEDENQTLKLHVKDHNALLPTSSIGDCVVEYKTLPENETRDFWIPLKGVKKGEVHVKVTRRSYAEKIVPKSKQCTSANGVLAQMSSAVSVSH